MTEELTIEFVRDLKLELRKSVRDLSQWKLYNSSKWSAEALNGMIKTDEMTTATPTTGTNATTSVKFKLAIPTAINTDINNEKSKTRIIDPMMGFSDDDYDLYLFASSLFDCKEFDRSSHYLKEVKEPRLKFLKLYSEFLVWDKKYMETTENILMTGRLDKKTFNRLRENDLANGEKHRLDTNIIDSLCEATESKPSNNTILSETGHHTSLSLLLSELREYMDTYIKPIGSLETIPEETKLGIALLYYLKGIILTRQGNKSNAITSFLKSLQYYIFNWGCWSELLNCISRVDESQLLINHIEQEFIVKVGNDKPQKAAQSNIMVQFFKLAIYQEFYSSSMDASVTDTPISNTNNNVNVNISTSNTLNDNANGTEANNIDEFFKILEYLLIIMPYFSFLKSMNAMISYNYMDYANAELIFDDIVKQDPYRLENLDVYSNILYVMQKHSKLTYLAQFVSQLDKFRPETCCIVANYYSARQEHEKSIMYFRRALVLNKKSTSAWTLMGHEFVELKNSHAAIECYRRAVDINERDYKAWYGLGQAYEVLDMHLYSLYYFQKACTLKPLDRRMWQAVAECYAVLKDTTQAIKCYQRAYQLSSNPGQDALLLFKLAKQYEQMMDIDNCQVNMLKCIAIEDSSSGELVTDETIKARLWLAQHEMRMKNYEAAYNHAVNITNGTSQEIEEARNIARNCRAVLK